MSSTSAFAVNSGITYHGRLVDTDGTTPVTGIVQFVIQIRTPDASDCLMYEETKSVDLTGSNGVFALTINDGTGTRTDGAPPRTDGSGLTIDTLFANRRAFTFNASGCSGSTTFTPAAGDGRVLAVTFQAPGMPSPEPMPPQTLNYAPYAFEALTLGGFQAGNLLRVVNSDGSLGTGTVITDAEALQIKPLVDGTSTLYAKPGDASNGTPIYSTAGAISSPSLGDMWLDTTTPGSNVLKIVTDAGTVSINTGAVTGSEISSGTIVGSNLSPSIGIATTSSVSAASVTAATMTSGNFVLKNGQTPANSISLVAPSGIFANYSLVLPTSAGTSGYVLSTDGAGQLSWIPSTSGSVTSVTKAATAGNPIVIGGTAVAPTIDIPAATSSVNGYLAAADFSSFSSKASGSLASGNIFVGSAGGVATGVPMTGDVSIIASGLTKVVGLQGVGIGGSAPGAAGEVLRYDGTSQYKAGFLSMADIRSTTMPGLTIFPTTSCAVGSALSWSSLIDQFTCVLIQIPVAQVSGLGSAAYLNVGTGSNSVVQLDGSSRLPAVDGSQLTNLTLPGGAGVWALNGANAYNTNTGNVGVGTDAPTQLLAVNQDDPTAYVSSSTSLKSPLTGTAAAVLIRNSDSNVGTSSFLGFETRNATTATRNYIGTVTNAGWGADLVFGNQDGVSNYDERLRIAGNSGFVGIGTTNPLNALDIGTGSGIHITAGIPSSTGAALYNNAGTLTWNGVALNSGSPGIGGSGTVNYLSAFTGANTLGNSPIAMSGANVGIGTTAPAALLDIAGAVHVSGSVTQDVGAVPSAGLTINGTNGPSVKVSDGTSVFRMVLAPGAGTYSDVAQQGDFVQYLAFSPSAGNLLLTAQNSTGGIVFATGVRSSTEAIRMKITNAGSVGIGTTAPQNPLDIGVGGGVHIASGLPTSTTAALYNVAGVLTWNGSPVTTAATGIGGSGTTNYLPIFSTSNTLTNSPLFATGGSVGIGTTAPASALHVAGDIRSDTQFIVTGAGAARRYNTFDYGIKLGAGGSFVVTDASDVTKMTVTQIGNVGIGTTAPANALDIGSSGGIHITPGTPSSTAAALYNNAGTLTWNGSPLAVGGASPWTASGSNIYPTTLTNSVGIGTSSPASMLHVLNTANSPTALTVQNSSATAAANASMLLQTDGGTAGMVRQSTVGGNLFMIEDLGGSAITFTTNGERARINPTGEFVVGNGNFNASPNAGVIKATDAQATYLDLAGASLNIDGGRGTGAGAGGGITFNTAAAGSTGTSQNALSERMRIAGNSGFVGIGTTNPLNALDIGTNGGLHLTSGAAPTNTTAALYNNGGALYWNGAAVGVGGSASPWTVSGSSIYNTTLTNNVGIGTTAPAASLDVAGAIDIKGLNGLRAPATDSTAGGSIAIGAGALGKQDSLASAAYGNTAVGYQTLSSASMTAGANKNTAVGFQAGAGIVSQATITAVGYQALSIGTGGVGSTAIGAKALFNASGDGNTALGNGAGANTGPGYYNVAIGANALGNAASSNTVAIGSSAGLNVSANNNTIIGSGVASTTLSTGGGNILLGTSTAVDTPTATTTNFLNIGNVIFATGMSGTLASPAGNVGIGTTAPAYALDVAGQVNASAFSIAGVPITAGGASAWAVNGSNISSTNTGNVGVGTSTPGFAAFEVRKGVANRAGYFAQDASSAGVALGTNGAGGMLTGYLSNGGDAPLYIQPNGVSNVAIGIGTAPVSKLDVGGGVSIGAYAGANAAPSNGLIVSGNVGIGTTAPGATLDVKGDGSIGSGNTVTGTNAFAAGNGNTSSNTGSIALGISSSATAYNSIALGSSSTSSGSQSTAIGYATQISGTRSVVIGTQSIVSADYAASLGNGVTVGNLTVGSGFGNNSIGLGAANYANSITGTGSVGIFLGAANGATLSANNTMAIIGGNVGIGTTSPAYKLDVAGSGNFQTLFVNGVAVGTGGSSPWTSNGSNISNSNSGNVGIGTTAPGQTLTVAGTGNFTGTLYVNSAGTSTGAGASGTVQIGDGTITKSWGTAFVMNSQLTVNSGANPGGVMTLGSNAPVNSVTDGTRTVDVGLATSAGNYSAVALAGDGVLRTQGQASNGNLILSTQASTGGIKFTTGSSSSTDTTKMMITGAGNVGIGTTAPSYLLDVATASSSSAGIHISNTGFSSNSTTLLKLENATSSATIGLGSPANSLAPNALSIATSTGFLALGTASLERLRIDTSGNVGIGTTAPGYKLDVAGQVNATAFSIAGVPISAGGAGAWSVNGSNISNTNSGNVGIGTTSPTSKLDFGTGGGDLINFWGTSAGNKQGIGIQSSEVQFYNAPANHWSFNSGGVLNASGTNEVMRINASGNVGIGTTAPAYKLDVNGNTNLKGVLIVSGGESIASTSPTVYTPTGSSLYAIGSSLELINSGGVVNNGASTAILLSNYNTSANSQQAYIGSFSNAGGGVYTPTIVIGQQTGAAAYAERMRIDPAGNVGIGTTAPVAALNVQGAIVSNTITNAAGTTNLNFLNGNVQVSNNSTNNAAFNLCGLQDGGSYTLVLKAQPIGSTPTFAAYSDAGCGTAIANFDSGGVALTTTTATTLITFIRAGTTVYAMIATGFTH